MLGMEARTLFAIISTMEKSRQLACTRIQAFTRGQKVRQTLRLVRHRSDQASRRIQGFVRASDARKTTFSLQNLFRIQSGSAIVLQAVAMGHQARSVVSKRLRALLSAQRLIAALDARRQKRRLDEFRAQREAFALERIGAVCIGCECRRLVKVMAQAHAAQMEAERVAADQAAVDELLMSALLVMGEATARRHAATQRIQAGLESMRVRRTLAQQAEEDLRRLASANRIKAFVVGNETRLWFGAATILIQHAKTMQAVVRGWRDRQVSHAKLRRQALARRALSRWGTRYRESAHQQHIEHTARLAEALWSQGRAWGVWSVTTIAWREATDNNMTAGGVYLLKRTRGALRAWRAAAEAWGQSITLDAVGDAHRRARGIKR